MMSEMEMIGLLVSASVVVIGFIIAIGNVISKNTKAITELTCAIERMEADMNEAKSHDRQQDDKLQDHEVRIVRLETKGGK